MKKILNFLIKYKIFVIIFIIVLVSILLYFFVPSIKYFNSKKFISNEYNISFYLPNDFKEIDNKTLIDRYNEAAKLGFSKIDSRNASFVIKIDEQKGKKNFNTRESMEELKRIFSEKLLDFKLIYMKESTFNDIPCIETEYIYSIPVDISGNKQQTRQKQIIFLKNEKLYWLIFASYPEDFDRDTKYFDIISQTFRINN